MIARATRDQVLTPREREVVEQLSLGLSNKEIGAKLGIPLPTVKCHLQRIKAKDPAQGNRHTAVKLLIRDHERLQAIRLNNWIQKWGDGLSPDALLEIRAILADQVAEVLK